MQRQQEEEGRKLKKKKQTKKENHKEQLSELKNWIEEQMMKEELKDFEEESGPSIVVKIDKKNLDISEEGKDIN